MGNVGRIHRLWQTCENLRLRGATLLEVVVASVVFMLLFGISLDTVSRLSLGEDNESVYIMADYAAKEFLRQYKDGEILMSDTEKEYDWGTVSVTVRSYGIYEDIRHIIIKAELKGKFRNLEYHHIVDMPYEEENLQ